MHKTIIIFFLFSLTLLMASEPITPLPQNVKVNQTKAKLGKELFFDPILSHDDTISCATCHNLQQGGDDGLKFSFGIKGQEGIVNAPTVYNAYFNFRQFWDGRAKDLQEQAAGPIENPIEMGSSFEEVIAKLKKSKYKKLFDALYKEGITKQTISDAIAEYEKTLITPNSRFDNYLRGDENALTQNEKEGYELFKSKGCASCHHGENIGGNLYNKFGIFDETNSEWLGRYNITHKERDKYFFKVPSLRNIARTAPYFHDGRTYNLKEAVQIMSQYQLGRHITKEEISKITAFLKSLNGELPKNIEP
ncbi:cytochrome-c peroxidase [Sulfurimonas autotrophica]|uniref:Cytochrome-c peroxidase n=1 Tax=Sulfurimonas autotrophica (strain ATCC BAA-671 / DSM 16294 / JCM 11897 / OK10) TaxID=563040 RepID=E0URG8_SULAO|nr:cytochrome-c peroxidase [Sulfurimonas autotrophica]ADN10054.1 Cytochrome-c peroxidase [Sulfurimonas autotrophica DSM 16294]